MTLHQRLGVFYKMQNASARSGTRDTQWWAQGNVMHWGSIIRLLPCSSVGIWGWIIHRCRRQSCTLSDVQNILGLYPPDVSSNLLLVMTIKDVSRVSKMSPGVQNCPWIKTTGLETFRTGSALPLPFSSCVTLSKDLTALSLNFLMCKIEIIILSIVLGCL